MKASDILRDLADLLDGVVAQTSSGVKAQQAIQSVEPKEVPTQDQTPVMVAVEVPNKDETEAGVFVPPLQAKLELLKKSVGVNNVYDHEGSSGQNDDLDRVKKLAGIQVASEDNDITG